MDRFQLRPSLGPESEEYRWEVESAVVQYIFLILSVRDAARRFQVLLHHLDVEIKELRAGIQALVANDEGAQELRRCLFDPLR